MTLFRPSTAGQRRAAERLRPGPQTLYNWDQYQGVVYQHMQGDDTGVEAQIDALEKTSKKRAPRGRLCHRAFTLTSACCTPSSARMPRLASSSKPRSASSPNRPLHELPDVQQEGRDPMTLRTLLALTLGPPPGRLCTGPRLRLQQLQGEQNRPPFWCCRR